MRGPLPRRQRGPYQEVGRGCCAPLPGSRRGALREVVRRRALAGHLSRSVRRPPLPKRGRGKGGGSCGPCYPSLPATIRNVLPEWPGARPGDPSQPAESAPLTSGNRALRNVKRGDFRFRSGGLAQLPGPPVLAGFLRVLVEDQAGGFCRPGARVWRPVFQDLELDLLCALLSNTNLLNIYSARCCN